MGWFVAIKDRFHAKKRLDSLEIAKRSGAYRIPVANLEEGSSKRICDGNRCETGESADSVHKLGRSRHMQDALVRLARNPQDACALVAVYDLSGNHLKASVVRWFGWDGELRSRALLSILAAIGRQAGNYDPQSMDAGKWIRQCGNAEARRLREAFDASRQHRPGPPRTI